MTLVDPVVRQVLARLSEDPSEAERFFAAPEAWLDAARPWTGEVDPATRQALARLDPDTLRYLGDADRVEPPLAVEHPRSGAGEGWITPAIALWGCLVYVLLWLVLGGSR